MFIKIVKYINTIGVTGSRFVVNSNADTQVYFNVLQFQYTESEMEAMILQGQGIKREGDDVLSMFFT